MRDMQLVQQILAGEQLAGERLVKEHYPQILRLLCHLTGSTEIARELTQQTFVKAWEGLGLFRGESSLATWICRIAHRQFTHWLRDRRDHVPLEEAPELIDDRAAKDFEAVLLRRALAQLTNEHREAWLLFHVQGLEVQEVAQVLGIPPGTVMSRLFNARKHLRTILSESNSTKEVASRDLHSTEPNCKTC